jgi:glucose/arabinose dehydrogenase
MIRAVAKIETLERRRLLAFLLAGFVEAPVTGSVDLGSTLEIAPDGKLFVAEQRGTLQVYSSYATPNQFLQPNFFRDAPLPVPTTELGEGGLIGFTFDPDYQNNRFIYVHYTRRIPIRLNRISRFTANASGDLALPGSEVVLLEIEPPASNGHNGGALHFGPDGKLYVAVGDHNTAGAPQSITSLKGKMLRINPTPGDVIPDDNPANISGIAGTTSGVHRAIWAAGLRNPFTFAFQPSTGRMFINDVGLTFEEVNEGGAGRNFGWPVTLGDFDPAQFPQFTRAAYGYRTGSIGRGVVGAAFYEPVAAMFPSDYVGDYFFGDLTGWIARLDLPTLQLHPFAASAGFITDLRVAPDGSLLYQRWDAPVMRVTFDNVAPTVTASAFDFDGVTLPDRPHRLRYAFSENVAASLAPNDLQLVNLTTGQAVSTSGIALSYDAPTNTATFTFPGFANAILSDGNYRATLRAAGVTDAAQNPLPEDHVSEFFFLRGDANRDGGVDADDFKILVANFGQSPRTFSQGDFNYDGIVNLLDFNLLASRFGAVLTACTSSFFNQWRGGDSDDDDGGDELLT